MERWAIRHIESGMFFSGKGSRYDAPEHRLSDLQEAKLFYWKPKYVSGFGSDFTGFEWVRIELHVADE